MIKTNVNKRYLTALIIIIAVFIVIMMLFFLIPAAKFNSQAMIEKESFDSRLTYYSGEEFYQTVGQMNEADFAAYKVMHILDYFFVLAYGALMIIITVPLLPRKFKAVGIVLPLIAALSDLIENISVDVLLAKFPQTVNADFVGVFTCIKWYGGAVWVLSFVLALAFYLAAHIKGNRAKGQNLNDGEKSSEQL